MIPISQIRLAGFGVGRHGSYGAKPRNDSITHDFRSLALCLYPPPPPPNAGWHIFCEGLLTSCSCFWEKWSPETVLNLCPVPGPPPCLTFSTQLCVRIYLEVDEGREARSLISGESACAKYSQTRVCVDAVAAAACVPLCKVKVHKSFFWCILHAGLLFHNGFGRIFKIVITWALLGIHELAGQYILHYKASALPETNSHKYKRK